MKKILLATVIVAASTGAIAQSFKSGYYAGGELGYTLVDNNAQNFANGLVAVNGGSSSVTQNRGLGIGRAFVGYKATENFDVELGYFQSGDVNYTFSGVSSGGTAYSGTTKVSVKGFDYSVLLRPSISSGMNAAYLRIGGHSSKEEATTSGTNIRGGKISESGTGYLYGAGYDINIGTNLDARLQITRLEKVAGTSDKATVFSVGILGKF